MTDVNLLKSKMALVGDTEFVKDISTILNVSRTTASKKLNNELPFSQTEIAILTKRYNLSAEDIKKIFVGGD